MLDPETLVLGSRTIAPGCTFGAYWWRWMLLLPTRLFGFAERRKMPNHKAIITTHAYLYNDSTLYDWAKKGKTQKWNPHNYRTAGGVNDGQQIWQKLAKKHANVFMVINGHVLNDGSGFLVSKGEHGNTVYQMLTNFQKPICPIGGEAWLRLLEFLPDGKTIQAKTYSPLYQKYKTDPDKQFVIKLTD